MSERASVNLYGVHTIKYVREIKKAPNGKCKTRMIVCKEWVSYIFSFRSHFWRARIITNIVWMSKRITKNRNSKNVHAKTHTSSQILFGYLVRGKQQKPIRRKKNIFHECFLECRIFHFSTVALFMCFTHKDDSAERYLYVYTQRAKRTVLKIVKS